MNNEKWNEICFLLSENIKDNVSENSFEQNVIQALSVLGWKEYFGDFDVRPSFPIGASNRIIPDFVIKSSDKKLFVIEIKHPNIQLSSNFQQQLFSYMRQLKLEYGILIGQGIQIFYDGDLAEQENPVLLEILKFEKNNEKGDTFVKLFSKESYNEESLKDFTLNVLEKLNRKENFIKLKNKVTSDHYKNKIIELIKQDFLNEYDGEIIESVFTELKIEITEKKTGSTTSIVPENSILTTIKPKETYTKGILPIELAPSDEEEFKKRLLLTKKATITIFYENRTEEKKTWKANSFNETSGVLTNLRSKSEFRQGEWQKQGITRVLVSIED